MPKSLTSPTLAQSPSPFRILFVTDSELTPYSVFNKIEQLSSFNHICADIVDSHSRQLLPAIPCYQTICFSNIKMTPIINHAITLAKKMGIPLVFSTDDLFFLPDGLDKMAVWQDLDQNTQSNFLQETEARQKTFACCNTFICSTPSQMTTGETHNKQTFLVKNALSHYQIAISNWIKNNYLTDKSDGVMRISYLSQSNHAQLGVQKIQPALENVLAKFPRARLVVWETLSIPSSLKKYNKQIDSLPVVADMLQPFILSTCNINLAPFTYTNESESAFIECGLYSIPTLYSATEAIQSIISEESLDFLWVRSDSDWEEKLGRLLEDPQYFQMISAKVHKKVTQTYSAKTNSHHLADIFSQLSHKKRPPALDNHDLRSFIKNAMTDCSSLFEEKSIDLFSLNELPNFAKLWEENRKVLSYVADIQPQYLPNPPDKEVPFDLIKQLITNNTHLSPHSAQTVDVIIPIYNAFEETTACIESVLIHTKHPFHLILINDGSPDKRVGTFLSKVEKFSEKILVINRSENKGFVKTVNEGFAQNKRHDVVILNSDTVVTANWLRKLREAAYSKETVATVTPLTNAGTICSVPNFCQDQPLVKSYNPDSFNAFIEASSLHIFPEAPTGVGFCMYIKRSIMQKIGYFDTVFGRGYGEENDFCQRALHNGFINIIADNTFVYHKGKSSFQDLQDVLVPKNLAIIETRYPKYHKSVEKFCQQTPLLSYHKLITKCLAADFRPHEGIDKRVLHILHSWGGGTEKHVRELVNNTVMPKIQHFILLSDETSMVIESHINGNRLATYQFPRTPASNTARDYENENYRLLLELMIKSFDINIIHVHQLIHNTLDIADISKKYDIPLAFTIHDYYTICPTINLVNTNSQYCEICTLKNPKTLAHARKCMTKLNLLPCHLIQHQAKMKNFFKDVQLLFAPSQTAKDVICLQFPEVNNRTLVVEHGARREYNPSPLQMSVEKLNIAFIGGISHIKGLDIIKQLLKINSNDHFHFHIFGFTADPSLFPYADGELALHTGSKLTCHGTYKEEDISSLLTTNQIHVGIQPAIWPETFSYVLSEFWSANIPVIVGNIGAPAERVRKNGYGWIVNPISAEKLLHQLESIYKNTNQLLDYQIKIKTSRDWRSLPEMQQDYFQYYQNPQPRGG